MTAGQANSLRLSESVYQLEAQNDALLFLCGICALVVIAALVLYALERRAHSATRKQAEAERRDLTMRIQAFSYDQFIGQKMVQQQIDQAESEVSEHLQVPDEPEFDPELLAANERLAKEIPLLQQRFADDHGTPTGD